MVQPRPRRGSPAPPGPLSSPSTPAEELSDEGLGAGCRDHEAAAGPSVLHNVPHRLRPLGGLVFHTFLL
jgi:hypothetical protein